MTKITTLTSIALFSLISFASLPPEEEILLQSEETTALEQKIAVETQEMLDELYWEKFKSLSEVENNIQQELLPEDSQKKGMSELCFHLTIRGSIGETVICADVVTIYKKPRIPRPPNPPNPEPDDFGDQPEPGDPIPI